MVFQHFSLFETLTVADNIALALEGDRAGHDLSGAHPRRVGEVRTAARSRPATCTRCRSASGSASRSCVACCRIRACSSWTSPRRCSRRRRSEKLFETLRRLAAEGCSILYISHKLDEIRALCHKATVLRAGKVTGDVRPAARVVVVARADDDRRRPAASAAPRRADRRRCARRRATCRCRPTIRSARRSPTSTSTVRAGEIVGIAGVSGNGQKELMAALSGERPLAEADTVTILGTPAGRLDAAQRRALGFAFVPEERLGRGAVPEMSLADNALLTAHREGMVARGFVRADVVRAYAMDTIRAYGVKAGGPDAAARSLSGGNLQKYIVGREIRQQPKLDDRRAAHVGRGRRRGRADPAGAARPARRRRRGARRVGGTRRAVRDLRPARRDRAGPAVRCRSRSATRMRRRSGC